VSEFLSRHKARQSLIREQATQLMVNADPNGTASRDPSRDEIEAFLAASPEVKQKLEDDARAQLPQRNLAPWVRTLLDISTLLIAIGGVSWLTMARVIRGQVMSLRAQPFMEAARALGLGNRRVFVRHLLPNLAGTITVYATLTVPQAILQESFLSFLGIGVKPPLASWGNLAADGLGEINPYQSHWWLPLFPCLLLSLTLLSLNFTGEALREALDPKRARKGEKA
jgi:ABC-type dipeptide/oligopeptide/nickel transport system permease subunit